MNDSDNQGIQKVLTALLLVQLGEMSDGDQLNLLIRAGYTNSEIARLCGMTENAIAIRKTRLKKGTKART